MRAALAVLWLVACGGTDPATAPPATPSPATPPPAIPEPAAPAVPTDDPSFYACTGTDPLECVIVTGACGATIAVNRAHSAEVTAIQSDLATRARCAPPPTSVPPIPMRGECQEGRCVAVPDMMADS